MTPTIYLDHNATTPPSPAVVEAVTRACTQFWHNPSSVHRAGQAARNQVELARQAIAELIGAKPRDLVFTSGGTEAIDLALRGVLEPRGKRAEGAEKTPKIVTTRVEHAAVRELVEDLEKRGAARVEYLPIDRAGVIQTETARALIGPDVALVVVQWANNETGAVQPVAGIGELCRAAGVPLIVDATQWVGKCPTDVMRDGPMDMLVFAPHKFHGVKGVGVLWARTGLRWRPQVHGAQELGRRGGTENVPGIVGAGVAAQEAQEWLKDGAARAAVEALRDRFERAVLAQCAGAVVNGPAGAAAGQRVWNTTNIAFPRLEAEAILLGLSERGVCASAGAACSSGSLDPSPVLLAMGVPPELAHGSVRFSLGKDTTPAEVDAAAGIVAEVVGRLAGTLPARAS